MAPARAHRFATRRACIVAGALALALAGAGCASAPKVLAPVAAPRLAQIAIANLTDYTWAIEARPAPGATVQHWQVAPRATLEIALAGGDYVFAQTIVSPAASVGAATRRVSATFEAGERYEWSLATLLSAPRDEAPAPAAAAAP